MARMKYFALTAAALLIVTVSGGTAPANGANTAGTIKRSAPAALTKVALVVLEQSAYEAWKSRDSKFWDKFLSDKFVGWGSTGRLDKASATKEYTGKDCDIRRYALSDQQVSPLDQDAALITHKLTVDGTCAGEKLPANYWAASVYVRDGSQWRGAFHAQAAIVDPTAAPVEPVDSQQSPNEENTQRANRDAHTDAMLAAERAVWDAWRLHDAKKLADLTARDISFINIFGVHLATKADALKDWSGTYCDVKSVSITDAAGTMLSPTVGILTHKATAEGTCFGQKVGAVLGSSVYIKHGDVWKWAFGINLPAPNKHRNQLRRSKPTGLAKREPQRATAALAQGRPDFCYSHYPVVPPHPSQRLWREAGRSAT